MSREARNQMDRSGSLSDPSIEQEQLESCQVSKSPDRRVLQDTLLPLFSRYTPILWIGCRLYTKNYYQILESKGAICWTLDIDSRNARWGNGGRHVIGDLLEGQRFFAENHFAAILFNGVLGWGIDDPSDQRLAFVTMAKIIQRGGYLLVGWNTDKINDPVAEGLNLPTFKQTGSGDMPPRIDVRGCTHVYDLFRADK
jgi:hypothetical protein